MPILVTCPSCDTRLRVPETAQGKRIKCPKCGSALPVAAPDDSTAHGDPEDHVSDRPSVPTRRRPAEDDKPAPRKPRYTEEEEPEEPEEGQESTDEADEPDDRPKKKKRRKKRRRLPSREEVPESPSWPWFVFGGGGAALVMGILLFLAFYLDPLNPFKGGAIYMLIALPVGTVIFFFAMFLSSVTVGAMEIGELHVAIVKAFILVFFANLVTTFLCAGIYLSFLIWIVGCITIFRLDFWEARMLIFINWVLNWIANFILLAAIGSMTAHMAEQRDHDHAGKGGKNAEHAVWDADDVEDRGGEVYGDPQVPQDPEIHGISFRNKPIGDAEMAHMKDFQFLNDLDLTNTRITDKGLAELKACKVLLKLTLTGTKVTEAGVQDLKKALPDLRVIR